MPLANARQHDWPDLIAWPAGFVIAEDVAAPATVEVAHILDVVGRVENSGSEFRAARRIQRDWGSPRWSPRFAP
jgi:hypothetical protein